jgi:peptide/nickel transport system permease protein
MNTATSTMLAAQDSTSRGPWLLAWRRFKQDRLAVAALIIVLLFAAVALASFTGLVAGHWNDEVAASYAPPSLHPVIAKIDTHAQIGIANPQAGPPVDISDIDPLAPRYQEWNERAAKIAAVSTQQATYLLLGADKWGHDVLSKTIKGSQVSISVGVLAALIAVFIGTLFGALAGYFGGVIDDALEWLYNIFTSIPYVLLILAIAAVFSRGFTTIVLILGLTNWTGVYRLVRAEYLKHSERAYVLAAQALGASHAARMFKHILPNISHVILVQYSRYVVDAIKAEVILSFLGLGVPVDMVSWGTILAETTEELVTGQWWQMLAAGGSMAIMVTAISLLTDAMRDALDPKLHE